MRYIPLHLSSFRVPEILFHKLIVSRYIFERKRKYEQNRQLNLFEFTLANNNTITRKPIDDSLLSRVRLKRKYSVGEASNVNRYTKDRKWHVMDFVYDELEYTNINLIGNTISAIIMSSVYERDIVRNGKKQNTYNFSSLDEQNKNQIPTQTTATA